MDKRWKIEQETDNWTDEDFAAIWYMLYQNSLNSNGTNKALVTKRYCEIDERVKKRLYTILKREKKKNTMKKQYIVSLQGVNAPKLFSVEDKLKKFGEVEMLCNNRDVASVFRLTTEDSICDAQKIKYAIKGLFDAMVEKARIFRVDEADCDETESVVEQDNPHGFLYCFSRFKTVAESRRKYEEVKPEFVEGHGDRKKHREMTFVEYLLGRYTDYEAKEVDYNSYLYRFFSA